MTETPFLLESEANTLSFSHKGVKIDDPFIWCQDDKNSLLGICSRKQRVLFSIKVEPDFVGKLESQQCLPFPESIPKKFKPVCALANILLFKTVLGDKFCVWKFGKSVEGVNVLDPSDPVFLEGYGTKTILSIIHPKTYFIWSMVKTEEKKYEIILRSSKTGKILRKIPWCLATVKNFYMGFSPVSKNLLVVQGDPDPAIFELDPKSGLVVNGHGFKPPTDVKRPIKVLSAVFFTLDRFVILTDNTITTFKKYSCHCVKTYQDEKRHPSNVTFSSFLSNKILMHNWLLTQDIYLEKITDK